MERTVALWRLNSVLKKIANPLPETPKGIVKVAAAYDLRDLALGRQFGDDDLVNTAILYDLFDKVGGWKRSFALITPPRRLADDLRLGDWDENDDEEACEELIEAIEPEDDDVIFAHCTTPEGEAIKVTIAGISGIEPLTAREIAKERKLRAIIAASEETSGNLTLYPQRGTPRDLGPFDAARWREYLGLILPVGYMLDSLEHHPFGMFAGGLALQAFTKSAPNQRALYDLRRRARA